MIISNDRFLMGETESSLYASQMTLTLRRLHRSDFSGFKCISKNSIGDAEGTIRLYEMESTKKNKLNQKSNENDILIDETEGGGSERNNGYDGNQNGPQQSIDGVETDGVKKKINLISRPHLYKSKSRNSTSIPFSTALNCNKPSSILLNIVFLISIKILIKQLS